MLNVTVKKFSALALVATLASCGGGGGGGGGGGSTYGSYSSPSITANAFVNALNDADAAATGNLSYVELYEDETLRSATAGEDQWFVIYDNKYNEHKAVSLQYIRTIVYYDYYSNNRATADEFRSIERNDILAGNTNGDFWGDDYEVVDQFFVGGEAVYEGRRSGLMYEDETNSFDVSLMAGELEQRKFIEKAAKVSFAYNVGIETSLALVSLGQKVEKKLGSNGGEITAADQAALVGDLEHLTGVSLADALAASMDNSKKQELLDKVAAKIGTSSENLEQRLLPELFGLEL